MAKNPVLPLYYNDILGSTNDWTDEEFGCYVRLLIKQWDKGFIPDNTDRLQLITTSVVRNWPLLKHKFTSSGEGMLQNKRLEEVRNERLRFIKSQREKATIRWQGCGKKPIVVKQVKDNTPGRDIEIDIPASWDLLGWWATWQEWKEYRKRNRIGVIGKQSKQRQINKLIKLSGENVGNAIEIIHNAIDKGWRGLYPLNNNQNGAKQQTNNAGNETILDSVLRNNEKQPGLDHVT